MAKKIVYPKLPKRFKEKWVCALRSGVYKQGSNMLLDITDGKRTYCCLGVACDIAGIGEKAILGSHFPTREIIKKNTRFPKVLAGDADNRINDLLSTMNDDGEYSFKRIATWIEKNL